MDEDANLMERENSSRASLRFLEQENLETKLSCIIEVMSLAVHRSLIRHDLGVAVFYRMPRLADLLASGYRTVQMMEACSTRSCLGSSALSRLQARFEVVPGACGVYVDS